MDEAVKAKRQRGKQSERPRIDGYHLFRRENRHYVYDLSSHRFFRVAEVSWNALRDLQDGLSQTAILARWSRRCGETTILAALEEIAELRRHGILKESFVPEVVSEAEIERITDTNSGNIQINIAQVCNLRCRYCYLATTDSLKGGLMKEEIG